MSKLAYPLLIIPLTVKCITAGCKQKRYQKKTPLSYVLAPAADNAGGGGNG